MGAGRACQCGAGEGDTLFGLHVLLVGPLVEWAGPLRPASAGRGSVCARHAVKRGNAVQMQHGHTTRQLCFHAGPACLLCGLGVYATRRSIFGRSWLGQRICGALIGLCVKGFRGQQVVVHSCIHQRCVRVCGFAFFTPKRTLAGRWMSCCQWGLVCTLHCTCEQVRVRLELCHILEC